MMVLLVDCFACRRGDHANCQGVIQAVPEGMMGGIRCSCQGECDARVAAQPTSDGFEALTDD